MDEKRTLEQYRQRWQPTPLEPVSPADKLAEGFHQFEELKRQILTPADTYQVKDMVVRIRKSGWRKLALAFDLSDEIVDEIQEKDPKDPKTWCWHVRVRVTSRSGRTVEGVSSCSTREREFKNADHETHALAHTRAKSRAIADMLGAGDLIAEEFDEEPTVKEETMPTIEKTQEQKTAAAVEIARTRVIIQARNFLSEILGETIMEHVSVYFDGEDLIAYLDKPVSPELRTSFLDRIHEWSYLAEENDHAVQVTLRKGLPKVPNDKQG